MSQAHDRNRGILACLPQFEFARVLDEDPGFRTAILLGTLPSIIDGEPVRQSAIVSLSRTHIPSSVISNTRPLFGAERDLAAPASNPSEASIDTSTLLLEENNDIYTWMFASFADDRSGSHRSRDVKVTLIFPATEAHIRKYTKQRYTMVKETPETYEAVVRPFILNVPRSRTQWVMDILEGRSEQDKVLFDCADFILLPDMKWDLTTVSSLYICAIARDESLKSLRDLRAAHIPLLKTIQREAARVVAEKWPAVGAGGLRMFIHYQPTYYHFHIHIVNVNGGEGVGRMAVGQAHLLDDVIALLEVQGEVYARTTLTYSLGDQHALYDALTSVA
ncbi:HIT-like domain-containing protein [Schizophyllum fasciatum]